MKQTEIDGVADTLIPDDWEVKRLGELFEMRAGGDVNKQHFSYYKSDKYKYKIFSNGLENEGVYGFTDLPRYKGDSITITGRGTVGVSMYRKDDFDAVIRLLVLESRNKNQTNNFFISELINEVVKFPNESTGVPQLTVPQIKDVLIPLPPLPEQQRIAKALSDVDALISTTEKLIQKKKNIKQGAMQNLLTGKKRLPGFGPQTKSPAYKQTELGLIPEDWEVKNIKELGVFISGSGFPLIEQGRKNEKYPFFKVSDFNNLGNENKLISASNYVSETVASKLCCKIVKKNSIVFAKIGAAIMLERKRITAYDCCIDNNMMAFTVNSDNDFSYLCYNFQQIPFASLSSSTALPSLSSKIIGNQLISVPLKEEQTAIANVLSSMDKEIETLNTKLEKYRNLKTAMMQQLLTGKIRLVK